MEVDLRSEEDKAKQKAFDEYFKTWTKDDSLYDVFCAGWEAGRERDRRVRFFLYTGEE